MKIPETERHQDQSESPELLSGKPSSPGARPRGRSALLVAAVVGVGAGAGGVYLAMQKQPERASPAEANAGRAAPLGATDAQSTPIGPATAASAAVKMSARKAAKAIYRCPMHPAITSDHPGSCPICGMTLVRDPDPSESLQVSAPESGLPGAPGAGAAGAGAGQARVAGLAAVSIDPTRQQMIGLRTTRVARAAMGASWRTVGRVEIDPTRVRRVNVKVESYVDRVFVDFVGKPVRKGQPLISMYSPNLLAAQEEYLLAVKTRRQLGDAGMLGSAGDDLVAASRRRLELWDVPSDTIDRLASTGVASKTLTLVSPIAGVVTAKNVVEGATLRPGDTLYEITDLRMVWVMADAYESDIPRVRVGMPATLSLPAYPDRVFAGRVEFIDPVVDPGSRTAKVHLHFANPAGTLKPEMFGDVVFRGTPRSALRIPADALVRTGTKDVVFVALGQGRFAPREVHIGSSDGDFVAVASGLVEGEEVVTRANFLVDSESRLRASLAALAGSP
jgi:Cu(I)/Ag(I) efflux system membrane fusion protein